MAGLFLLKEKSQAPGPTQQVNRLHELPGGGKLKVTS